MIKGEKFNKAIIDYIVSLGAVKTEDNLRFVLETRYGKLNISLRKPDKQKTFLIFTQFEEPKRAKGITGNPISGKWNFYINDMNGIKSFKNQIKLITSIDKEYLDTFNPGDKTLGGYIKIADQPDNHIIDCFLNTKGEIKHYSTILSE